MESKPKTSPEVSAALEPIESRIQAQQQSPPPANQDEGGTEPGSTDTSVTTQPSVDPPSSKSGTTELDVRASASFIRWLSTDEEETQTGFLKGFVTGLLVAVLIGLLITFFIYFSPGSINGKKKDGAGIEFASGSLAVTVEKHVPQTSAQAATASPSGLSAPEEPPIPEWENHIRQQLEKRISFDFVKTPLGDVVAFFTNLTGLNFVLDPAAVEESAKRPITLKVNDMRLAAALDWILRLNDLTYVLRDEAIFISTRDRIAEPMAVRVYDCRGSLRPEAEAELIRTIQEMVSADWRAEAVSIRFVDSRLILRQRNSVLRDVDAFMMEFLGKSRDAAAEISPREGGKKRISSPLSEARESPATQLARRAGRGDDYDRFWAKYVELIQVRKYGEAEKLALAGLNSKGREGEGGPPGLEALMARHAKDAHMLAEVFARAEKNLGQLAGKEVKIQGLIFRIEKVIGDRIIGTQNKAEFGITLEKLGSDLILNLAFEPEEDALAAGYHRMLLEFFYGSAERFQETLVKAKAAGADVGPYEKWLAALR